MPGVVIFAGLAIAAVLGAVGVVGAKSVDLVYLIATVWACAKLALMRIPQVRLVFGAALFLATTLTAIRLAFPDLRYAPYLVVLPANVFITYIFARGLLPGRQPILIELIRLMGQRPLDNPRFVQFVWGQCLLWAALSFATAVLALLCIIWGTAYPAVITALGALAAIQLIWLPLSHIYAGMRYGRPERLLDTIRTLSRPEGRALISP